MNRKQLLAIILISLFLLSSLTAAFFKMSRAEPDYTEITLKDFCLGAIRPGWGAYLFSEPYARAHACSQLLLTELGACVT